MKNLNEFEKKRYIGEVLTKLMIAYQDWIKNEYFDETIEIISEYLNKKKELTHNNLMLAYYELIQHYTLYRKINAASFITALETRKQRGK